MPPCPGCGTEYAGTATTPAGYYRASPDCVATYHDLSGLILNNAARLGPSQQLCSDTYAAQHVGPRMRPITTWFALVGLHLALDHARTGPEVRAVHQHLSASGGPWPTFVAPDSPGPLTVRDVPRTLEGDALGRGVTAWAQAVWQTWLPVHEAVASLCLQARASWGFHDRRRAT